MDFYDIILTRRSVRSYNGKPVPPEAVDALLRAAMHAPSAHNRKPWRFVIVHDRAVLDAIHEVHPYSSMMPGAPMCIVVCYDKSAGSAHPEVDCAAATQNILLCAHAMGIASVWLSAFGFPHQAGVGKAIGLPDGVEAMSVVVLGYTDDAPVKTDRYDASMIHHGKW